jgi:hypothetical protein
MEYRKLIQLDNKYPNLRNYKPSVIKNEIILDGVYPELNRIQFKYPDIKNISPISETSFRFILGVKKNKDDKEPKYFTSVPFYNDFLATIDESNPYLLQSALDIRLFVNIDISELLKIVEDNKKPEEIDLVFMNKNLFVNDKGEIDYESLIKYIDSCLLPPNPNDFENGGVTKAELLGTWTVLEVDPTTGKAKAKSEVEAARSLENYETELKNLEKELKEVNGLIKQAETELNSKNFGNTNLWRTLGLVVFFPLSLLSLIGSKKRKEEAKAKLKEKIDELKVKKADIEKQIVDLKNKKPASTPATGSSSLNTQTPQTTNPIGSTPTEAQSNYPNGPRRFGFSTQIGNIGNPRGMN